jgi:trigger factor
MDEKAKREHEQKVLDELVKISTVEYPPALLEAEIDRLIREELRRYQLPDDKLGDYLRAMNKTLDKLREELKPLAQKYLAESILMGEAAKAEKVEFSEAEIDAEVEKMVGAVSEENKENMRNFFNSPGSRDSIRRMYMGRRTVDKLTQIAGSPPEETGQAEGQTEGTKEEQK